MVDFDYPYDITVLSNVAVVQNYRIYNEMSLASCLTSVVTLQETRLKTERITRCRWCPALCRSSLYKRMKWDCRIYDTHVQLQ